MLGVYKKGAKAVVLICVLSIEWRVETWRVRVLGDVMLRECYVS